MAEEELPTGAGVRLRGNEEVPLVLACRTMAKSAASLAVEEDSNDVEIQVCANSCLIVYDS